MRAERCENRLSLLEAHVDLPAKAAMPPERRVGSARDPRRGQEAQLERLRGPLQTPLGDARALWDDELRMSGPRVGAPPALHPVTSTFRDAEVETEFRRRSFESNLIQIRIAHVLGILLWVVWGLLVRGDLGPDSED